MVGANYMTIGAKVENGREAKYWEDCGAEQKEEKTPHRRQMPEAQVQLKKYCNSFSVCSLSLSTSYSVLSTDIDRTFLHAVHMCSLSYRGSKCVALRVHVFRMYGFKFRI